MPITGSQPALMFAQSGKMRCGASRSGYYTPATPMLYIGGVRWDSKILKSSLTVDLALGGPSSLSADAKGPLSASLATAGPEVILSLGSKANRLFAGYLVDTQVLPRRKRQTRVVRTRLTCTDYTYTLQRRVVLGKSYINRGVITVLHDLVYAIPSGLRPTINCQSGFANVDFEVNAGQTVLAAIDALATRVGARWYLDARNVLHFFSTFPTPGRAPLSLTTDATTFWGVGFEEDTSQPRTRVYVFGAKTKLTTSAATNATVLNVDDATKFSASGGQAALGPSLLTYTGTVTTPGGQHQLTGVTGLLTDAVVDTEVRIVVMRNNTAAQTALASRIGSNEAGVADDGISEYTLEDDGLSDAQAIIRADAELNMYAAEQQLSYTTRDLWTVPGPSVSASISQPKAISGNFEIHTVRISQFGLTTKKPRRDVVAGNVTVDLVGIVRALTGDLQR